MIDFNEYRAYDAVGLADLIARKQVSAAEVLEAAIARTEVINPTINAVVHKQYDTAGQAIADGIGDGPFAGVPYMMKDLGGFQAGQRCTMGSRLFADFVPDHNLEYTDRCLAAGLLIMGRTNTPEFGMVANTEPVLHGPTRNPWDLERSAGGSSGGAAAAVAAGILPMAHATDGGGSIRIPAANCGLFGLKPSRGRNPAGPDVGEGWAGLACGHVVSRSVRDSAVMLDCTHGAAPGDPYAAPRPERPFAEEVGRDPGQLKIALMTDGHDGRPLSVATTAGVLQAAKLCEDLGHHVEPATPDVDNTDVRKAMMVIIAANTWNMVSARWRALGREPTAQDLETVAYEWAMEGPKYSASEYAAAVAFLHATGRKLGAFLMDYDVVLGATMRNPPIKLGEMVMTMDLASYRKKSMEEVCTTPIYNATGGAAMSVPLHWTDDGLPVGIHFGAELGGEAKLLRLAAQLEEARPWFDRLPPV
jgi:Asp-tRNA(Asn)/Glu-tRNA(Gln) amidotransferase A subunit family amidase